MVIVAMRARAFALKKDGKEDDGKKVLREVIEMQLKLNEENEKKKAEEEAKRPEEAKKAEEAAKAQTKAVAAS